MSRPLIIAILSTLVCSTLAAAAAPRERSLDLSFGNKGHVLTLFSGGYSYALAVLPDADGKVVAAGYKYNCRFALARYDHRGRLDTSFGGTGRLTLKLPGCGLATTLARSADGRLLVGGTSGNDFALVRLDQSGRLDPSFGDGGIVTTSFGVPAGVTNLRITAGGSILAVGGGGDVIAAARYGADGRLDRSFGSAGILVADFSADPYAEVAKVRSLADGSIVAAGQSQNELAVARLLPDGRHDPSFGNGGIVTVDLRYNERARYRATDFAASGDGRITVVGVSGWCDDELDPDTCVKAWEALRLTADGRLDPTFSHDGIRPLPPEGEPKAVAISRSGEIAIGGLSALPAKAGGSINVMGIVLLHPDGSYDRRLRESSTGGGVIHVDFTGRGWHNSGDGSAIAWDRQGKLVAAGTAAGRFALARFRLLPLQP